MYYVIANFYYIPSSLYAYRGLSSPRGRDGQDARGPVAKPCGEGFLEQTQN